MEGTSDESKSLYFELFLEPLADAKMLAEQLPPPMPELFQAADIIDTMHYSRFTVLSEKTLLFLGDMAGKVWQWAKDW
jgi:hypothetical protein